MEHGWHGHPLYEAGRQAAARGAKEDENPFAAEAHWTETHKHYAWFWGWTDAQGQTVQLTLF